VPVGDVLPEIALVVAAAVVLLSASFLPRRLQWLGAPLALVGLGVAAVLLVPQLAATRLTFSGAWALDTIATGARLVVVAVAALSVLLSPGWMARDPRHGEYYAMLLFGTVGAVLLCGAADLMQLALGVLLSSVAGYTLATYHRAWPTSVEAGMKFFLVGALASALMMTGIALLFGLAGTTRYEALAARLAAGVDPLVLVAAVALVLVGLAFKMAAVPAHAWMPDVAEASPVPAAAFLTVAPKVGAAVALARLVDLLPAETVAWRPVVAALAVATMTLGNLAALWQDDVRRLLGWSSVSQSGYALVAIVVVGRSAQALPALVLFLAAYAAANLAAFAVVAELRGRTSLADYRGLGATRPLAATVLVLALLSLVGIPPLAGFAGKLALFAAAIDGGYAWLAVVAVANTVVSLFYYLRVIAPLAFERPAGPVALLGPWSRATMLIAALATVGLGLGAEWLLGAFDGAALLP
jgi:NADH-quinone oxidoreductase subunit N